MGRLKQIVGTLINKTENFLSRKPETSVLDSEPISDTYEMIPGKKPSREEIIQENRILMQSLDPKLMFLVGLVREIKQEDILQTIAEDHLSMQQWLAHIAYRTKMENFNNLICGKNLNSLDPSVLVPKKHRKEFIGKTIKCLTDLPLQKSLLN